MPGGGGATVRNPVPPANCGPVRAAGPLVRPREPAGSGTGWAAQLPPPSRLTRNSACARQPIETQPVPSVTKVRFSGRQKLFIP